MRNIFGILIGMLMIIVGTFLIMTQPDYSAMGVTALINPWQGTLGITLAFIGGLAVFLSHIEPAIEKEMVK